MARPRVRAQVRTQEDEAARTIASGVYSVARHLAPNYRDESPRIRHVALQFPRPMAAVLVYLSELLAVERCIREGWDRSRADELALYFFQGIQEATIALVKSWDEEHFEAWVAAAKMRDLI